MEMKLGYPCLNLSMDCRSSKTFRLKNYSEEKLVKTIENNLSCLLEILQFNKMRNIYFFRITSDLIPFASHPVMKFDWKNHFEQKFQEIGEYILQNSMRITMHPGQYTVLNSINEDVVNRSILELLYHVEVLDLMQLEKDAKVQIHVGGVYGDKDGSIRRFIKNYKSLNTQIKNRLVIENDDKSYTLNDCMKINKKIEIPVIFDVYHHKCKNSGESINTAFNMFSNTWKSEDGIPIVHYSSEHPIKGKPSHAEEIDMNHFKNFLESSMNYDFDLMLEIKNKEKSALRALKLLINDPRFFTVS